MCKDVIRSSFIHSLKELPRQWFPFLMSPVVVGTKVHFVHLAVRSLTTLPRDVFPHGSGLLGGDEICQQQAFHIYKLYGDEVNTGPLVFKDVGFWPLYYLTEVYSKWQETVLNR